MFVGTAVPAQQPAGTLNVKTDGAAMGDGVSDDALAIQTLLDTAESQGKDLYFPPGTYVIGSDITTGQGVSLLGDRTGLSVIRSAPGTARKVGNQTWSDPSSNIDVEDLHFLNVGLHWYGSESVRKNIDVRRCLFMGNDPAFANTVTNSYFQFNLGHVVDGVMEDCIYLRQPNCTGGSASGYKTVRQTYRRSVWGLHLDRVDWLATQWTGYAAWTDLLPKLQTLRTTFGLSADQGHFRRGIQINGCRQSLVEGNIFNGSPYTSTTPVNRDHVVYAHGGYTDLVVVSNWMRGWPSAPNGGLKIRNTLGPSTVIANYFVNTPLLQYAYANNDPQAYQNAIVHRNHFEIYQNFSDGRLGISFWETVDGIPPQTNNEYSANVFECPKAYGNAINLTNGDLAGHTAYDSNVYLFDGAPVSTAHQSGPFALLPGAPNSARTAPYDSYSIPLLEIPLFTTAPAFTTNRISLGYVVVGQSVSGSLAGKATDADGESLEFMKMDGPAWLQVDGDGSYAGTPSLGDGGLNQWTVRAADNRDGYGAATLVVHVIAAEDADDWDKDGMPNLWELAFFGGETNAVASLDADGDGFDNLAEFITGSNPTNSASFFSAGAAHDSSGLVVSWEPLTGRTYRVLHCAEMGGSAFSNLQTGLVYPQGSFTDTTHSAEASGFYTVDVHLAP